MGQKPAKKGRFGLFWHRFGKLSKTWLTARKRWILRVFPYFVNTCGKRNPAKPVEDRDSATFMLNPGR